MARQEKSIDPWGLWVETAKGVLSLLSYRDRKTGEKKPIEIWPEWEPVLWSPAKKILVMGGEGSGKSMQGALFATCHMVYDALFGGKLYWVVGGDFEDARKDFQYIVDFQEQLGNIASLSMPSTMDLQCILETKTGQRVITVSGYDPTKVGRDEPDGIVGAEVSRWFQELFERCEGRLVRRPRSWGFFSGSFETSEGWLPDLFKVSQGPNARGLRSYTVPTWANRYLYPGGRQDPLILEAEATRSPQKFLERYGGVPAPGRAIILDDFNVSLHVDSQLEYDPALPVYLGIDPGHKVYAVEFVQLVENGEIRVIDEIYEARWTHEQVIQACRLKAGWPMRRGGAIDVAGTSASSAGLGNALDAWRRDTGLALFGQKHAVEDTIETLRAALSFNPKTGRPRLRVHPRCRGLIAEMGGGPSPVEEGGAWRYWETKAGLGPPRSENDHACFDRQTDILTETGWKRFEHLQRNEKVATRAPDGTLEYQLPTEILRLPYTGPLATYNSNRVNFAITPEHHLYLANQTTAEKNKLPKFELLNCEEMDSRMWLSRIADKWEGQSIADFALHERGRGRREILPLDFARFYGLWLAEGCKDTGRGPHKNRVIIDQKRKVADVEKIVASLGLSYSVNTAKATGVTRFTIECAELHSYFTEQGHSWDKRVPRYFLNAPVSVLKALLEGYMLGDGSSEGAKWIYVASTGYGLLSDMQEAAFKMGLVSNITQYQKPSLFRHGLYHLSFNYTLHGLTSVHQDRIQDSPYKGEVFCVTVPNGVIAVRRQGKIMWSGNSKALAYLLAGPFGGIMAQNREDRQKGPVSYLAGRRPTRRRRGFIYA